MRACKLGVLNLNWPRIDFTQFKKIIISQPTLLQNQRYSKLIIKHVLQCQSDQNNKALVEWLLVLISVSLMLFNLNFNTYALIYQNLRKMIMAILTYIYTCIYCMMKKIKRLMMMIIIHSSFFGIFSLEHIFPIIIIIITLKHY